MWIKDKRLYDKYPSILYINELRVLINFIIYGGIKKKSLWFVYNAICTSFIELWISSNKLMILALTTMMINYARIWSEQMNTNVMILA